MRPRVFPAEDTVSKGRRDRCTVRFNEAAGIPRGRHTQHYSTTKQHTRFNEAAGIPRGRLGPGAPSHRPTSNASMRPRVFPAEDDVSGTVHVRRAHSFNEAAGIPRGRRAGSRKRSAARRASMRPRVFPAEDTDDVARVTCPACSFNEAAGIPRGRQSTPGRTVPRPRVEGFNEAAGIPRGRRLIIAARRPAAADASMRPRVFPAEDSVSDLAYA